jgi:hypothetical protein
MNDDTGYECPICHGDGGLCTSCNGTGSIYEQSATKAKLNERNSQLTDRPGMITIIGSASTHPLTFSTGDRVTVEWGFKQ